MMEKFGQSDTTQHSERSQSWRKSWSDTRPPADIPAAIPRVIMVEIARHAEMHTRTEQPRGMNRMSRVLGWYIITESVLG